MSERPVEVDDRPAREGDDAPAAMPLSLRRPSWPFVVYSALLVGTCTIFVGVGALGFFFPRMAVRSDGGLCATPTLATYGALQFLSTFGRKRESAEAMTVLNFVALLVLVCAIALYVAVIKTETWLRPVLPDLSLLFSLLAVTAAGCVFNQRWAILLRRPDPTGLCDRCGYDLTGNVSGVCPECGASAPPR